MTDIFLATEDELSEEVCLRLVRDTGSGLNVGTKIRKGGNGYLKSRINSFFQIANREPILLLTDLDSAACPSALINNWIGNNPVPPKLLFRVAVREVEAWLLADHEGLRTFLKFRNRSLSLPRQPDHLPDPKQELLRVSTRASRDLRIDILPKPGSHSLQGLGYNRRFSEFVRTIWSPNNAANRSPSLCRARQRLTELARNPNIGLG